MKMENLSKLGPILGYTHDNCYITSPPISGHENMLVSSLLDRDNNAWKKDVFDVLFSEEDAQKFLKLSLLNTFDDDKLIWHLSQNSMYSVKSAYHNIMDTIR